MLENCILKLRKGNFLSVTTFSSVDKMNEKLLKRGFKDGNPMLNKVTKVTTFKSVRICSYEELNEVKENRKNGVVAKEPWFNWEVYPYICVGKKNPKRYLVVKPLKGVKPVTRWFVDGVEVPKSVLKPYLKAESVGEMPRMFTLELESITELKQGNISFKR